MIKSRIAILQFLIICIFFRKHAKMFSQFFYKYSISLKLNDKIANSDFYCHSVPLKI